jgi:hypothetical protein
MIDKAPINPAPEHTATAAATPILVCGHPKSGTTLMATLLDGHSQITVLPEETFYLRRIAQKPNLTLQESAQWLLNESGCKRFKMGTWESSLSGNFDYEDFDYATFEQSFQNENQQSRSHGEVLTALVSAYATATNQESKRYWLEKSPGNEAYWPLAQSWYPDLWLIYIVRDPRDVFTSYSIKREEDGLGKDNSVEGFVHRWGMSIWYYESYAAAHANTLLIRYEDLLRAPTETLSLLCHRLGITFEPQLEVPTKNAKPWNGNSMHGDKFNAVSTKPIGRWKNKVDTETIRIIEAYLGKAMIRYGYQLSQERPSLFQVIKYWLKNRHKRKLIGVMLRLYWPFRLPNRISRI